MSEIEKSTRNQELLFVICLISKPGSPSSMSRTMRNHVRKWERAGIVPHIPISSGFTKERFRRFIQKYSEEDDSNDS
nr:MAG: hypothetical protein [uncultured archaeon]BDI55238.1 MAG: hypothetical protein [uncultured archaeon]